MKIAKHDCYGVDNVGVRRFIRAGDPVPDVFTVDAKDIIERPDTAPSGPAATVGAPGVGAAAGPASTTGQAPPAFADMSVEDLQAEADRRGLKVAGTGANGNVLKGDLVSALEGAGA